MARSLACNRCGEEIVFLDRDGRRVPVDAELVDEGETVFDPAVHQRHVCVGSGE